MISPIPVGQIKDFVLPTDKKDPTIWRLGTLDSIVKTLIMSKSFEVRVEGEKIKTSPVVAALELDIEILKFGLKGWTNFKLNGKEITFKIDKEELGGQKYDVLSRDSIKFIPRNVVTTLANEIFKENELSEEAEKN